MSTADRVSVTPKNPYTRPGQLDLASLFPGKSNGGAATWEWADPESLKAAISGWTRQGNAITFGRTSDGGALSISLLTGGKPFKLYAADADELEALLTRIAGIEAP